jgi:hypothetical protein
LGIIVNFRNEYLNPKRVLNPDTTPWFASLTSVLFASYSH